MDKTRSSSHNRLSGHTQGRDAGEGVETAGASAAQVARFGGAGTAGSALLHDYAMAEIGRIISSSLDIDEVYEPFARQVQKLVSFDGIAISLLEADRETLVTAYMFGPDVSWHWSPGNAYPLAGTVSEDALADRRGVLFSATAESEMRRRHSGSLPAFEAGMRSFLTVPLGSRNEVSGILHLMSGKSAAYTQDELGLAEQVGTHIAGAVVANARLYRELRRSNEARRESEEHARQLAHRNEVLAEMGRIMSSSLDIDEVYERFVEQVAQLIPLDRIAIHVVDLELGQVRALYSYGVDRADLVMLAAGQPQVGATTMCQPIR